MNKKLFLYSILFFFLCMLDLAISSITHLYISLGFLAFILSKLNFPYMFYFAFISGIIIDLIFYAYIGPFLIILLLLALIVYILKTFYVIKPFFLQFILLVLFFTFAYFLGKNFASNLKSLLITILFAFIWYLIKIPVETQGNERGK